MDARLQRRVQRYGWDKAEAHYERFWQAQLAPAQERLLSLAALRPGMRVLDVACGTGLVTFKAAEAVSPAGAVTATDISDAMVAHVATEAVSRGSAPITTIRMDAESLDFPDGSFDVALAYARFDGETRDGAHAEYLDSIAPWRDASGYDVPGEFVVAAGVVE
jgi:cyclopropane fatty-acyl-phospholipid synthase-like methyltransferase